MGQGIRVSIKKYIRMLDQLLSKLPFDNIQRSWKTTLIGIIAIIAGIVSVFFLEKVTWLDASSIILLGIVLLFANDKKPGPPSAMCVLVALALLMSGCVTYERCARKYNFQQSTTNTSTKLDSVSVKHSLVIKDTIVDIEGDSVDPVIINPCDSLTGLLKQFEIERRGKNKHASLSVKSVGNKLHIECDCDPWKKAIQKIIEKYQVEIKDLKSQTTKDHKTSVSTPKPAQNKKPWYVRHADLFIALLIAYIAGWIRLHKILYKLYKTLIP